jgi:MoaA/NifB/PqqE/SkfB family radical SAM enzyme
MYFTIEGDVYVCCYNQKHNLGNIGQKSIKDIWNSRNAEKIRHHVKNNYLISGCDECKYLLQTGQFESAHISDYDNILGHKVYPTKMEFQFSNLCNLECTMCTGDYSSSIALNRENRKPHMTLYGREFVDQLEEFVPHLKIATFSGGEPFISPIYYDIWKLIQRLNPHCKIVVQTNGTVLNEKVKKALEQGQFNIGISLDSLNEETYNNIRVNATLKETLANIMFFKDYCHTGKHTISISVCPMQQNWIEMPQMVKFCNDNGIRIHYNTVWFPGKNALWILDSDQIMDIVNVLSDANIVANTAIQIENVKTYQNLIKTLTHWGQVAKKWEKCVPKEVDALTIENIEKEIIEKIQGYLSSKKEGPAEDKYDNADVIIQRLKRTFHRIPNDDLKLKGLQLIAGYREEKIIANIFREDEEGLYLLIKNLHRFRDL